MVSVTTCGDVTAAVVPAGTSTVTLTVLLDPFSCSVSFPRSTVVVTPAPGNTTCAAVEPAPNVNTTPNSAIHFSALQLPLAKIAPVRMSQSPL